MLRRIVSRVYYKKRPPDIFAMSIGQRIRNACVELGPTFIKFAQLLSNRKDIVPRKVLAELEKLQDEVPPFPTEKAKEIIEKNLNEPVDNLFLTFYEEPEAAASLSQVHRAILPGGQPVAVKVQRPNIEEQVESDIAIMYQFASFVDSSTKLSDLMSATELVEEFERQIHREMDFREELLSIRKFQEAYRKNPVVRVPEVYRNYSTPKLLVLEFIHGKKISDVIESTEERYDKKLINMRTTDFIMDQLFVQGFFHADPHPGNFLVIEDEIICFIDFGMVYSLRPYEQEHLNYMMIGLARLDPVLVARSLLYISGAGNKLNMSDFQASVHDYIENHLNKPIEYINLSAALIDLLQMLGKFGIRLPSRLVYVAKVVGTMEAVGTALDPEFRLLDHLKEFSPKIWTNQVGSNRAQNRMLLSAINWGEFSLEAPQMLQDAGRLLQDRRFDVHVPEAERMRETLDKVGFRLVYGLVLSSLLISSSLVVLADIEPKIFGIPLFGILGFGIGGVMGITFLFDGIVQLIRWNKKP